MSGPYHPLYLLPPVQVPVSRAALRPPEFPVGEWISERFEILNADMRNAWSGEPCFSENASVISHVLVDDEALRAVPGLDRVSWNMVNWSELEEPIALRGKLVSEKGNGLKLTLSPDLCPDAWIEARALAEVATDVAERLKAGDPALIEVVRGPVVESAEDVDFAEFLSPDRQAEVGEMPSEQIEDPDGEIIAAVGASVFATIAWHAYKLADEGAEKVLFADIDWGWRVPRTALRLQPESPTSEGDATPRKGWLSRLFGG